MVVVKLCANARANYYLRALPPSLSREFAESHDASLLQALLRLLDHPDGSNEDMQWATAVAHLPLRGGGLGLRSAVRVAPAAYWASWADCLAMIRARHPTLAGLFVHALEGETGGPCLRELQAARSQVVAEGFAACPGWRDLALGARPQQVQEDEPGEPGEWPRGWQRSAASAREQFAREALLNGRHALSAQAALLRSQSGPCGGKVFTALPTSTLTTVPSAELRVLLLRRLHLPIPMVPRRCQCRGKLDSRGHHRAGCSTCGVLRRRGKPLEKAAARVCREAGARVAENVLLRDMNIGGISGHDGRNLEVVANGLPLWGGAQLAVDTTLVCPVRRNGTPQPGAATTDGTQLGTARTRKEVKYRELLASRRCRLVVLAIEVGGRWSEEAVRFIRLLAKAKARTVPALVRAAAKAAFLHRWTGILAVAALAATLLELPVDDAEAVDGDMRVLEEVLGDARLVEAPLPSRLA